MEEKDRCYDIERPTEFSTLVNLYSGLMRLLTRTLNNCEKENKQGCKFAQQQF